MVYYSDAIHFSHSFLGRDLGYHSAKHPERLQFRHRSIVDVVPVWDRFEFHLGSVWGPFRVCFGSIMRSGSDFSLRASRDQVSIPLGPILALLFGPHVGPMLAVGSTPPSPSQSTQAGSSRIPLFDLAKSYFVI